MTQIAVCAPEEKVELIPMDFSEMPRSKFSVHILAVLDAGNISFRPCSLVSVRCILLNGFVYLAVALSVVFSSNCRFLSSLCKAV